MSERLPPSCVDPTQPCCISVNPVPKPVRPIGSEPVEIHHKHGKKILEEEPVIAKDLLKMVKKTNMGLGQLGSPDIIFVRKFRWTLEGKNFKEQWAKRCMVDYHEQTIEAEIYDVVIPNHTVPNEFEAQLIEVFPKSDIPTLEFLEYMDDEMEELTLTVYDGCGQPLYAHTFLGVRINRVHPQEFDYSKSDEQTLRVTLSYDKIKTLRGKAPRTSPQSSESMTSDTPQSQT